MKNKKTTSKTGAKKSTKTKSKETRMGKELALNGVSSDGSLLTEGVTTDMIAKVARGQTLSAAGLSRFRVRQRSLAENAADHGATPGAA